MTAAPGTISSGSPREHEPSAAGRGEAPGLRHDPVLGLVAVGMGEADLHAHRRAQQRERVVDVVAVPDERERQPAQLAEPLVEREQVGQRLARMLAQRQAVDHRHARLRRQLDHDLVRPGPGHDRVDEPLEVLRDVAHRLPGAHDDILGQVDRRPAELRHPRLERHARPQAGLLEQHRERPATERRIGVDPVGWNSALSSAARRNSARTSSRDRSAADESRPFSVAPT